MFITLRRETYLPWRAVNEHRTELDILVQKPPPKRFFKRICCSLRRQ